MRFLALDGWRGIAAILVALYHLGFYNHIHDMVFLRNSYLFVDFFFVLSGFVISYAYQHRLKDLQQVKEFIIFRIARLWPLHLFVLALFIALELAKLLIIQKTGGISANTPPFSNEYSVESIVSNILLLQSINLHEMLTWNYPSWSISVEFYTYLVFVLFTLLTQFYKKLSKPLYLILFVGSFIVLFFSVDSLDDATYHNGIFRCIIGFFLGNICYKVYTKYKNKSIPYPTFIELLTLVGIISFVYFAGDNKYSLLAPFIFVLSVYIFAFEQGAISKILKIKAIQNIGKWSYSIYMIHAFLLILMSRLLNITGHLSGQSFSIPHTYNNYTENLFYIGNAYVMDFLTLLYVLILLLLASLSYKFIEKKGSYYTKKVLLKPKLPIKKAEINHHG